MNPKVVSVEMRAVGFLDRNVTCQDIVDCLMTFSEDVAVSQRASELGETVSYSFDGERNQLNVKASWVMFKDDDLVHTIVNQRADHVGTEVIRRIVSYFGGHFMSDDASGDSAIRIEKSSDFELKLN